MHYVRCVISKEGNNMIYFDNAATTKCKPDEVYSAVNYYLREIGVSPGRGSYDLGIEASRMLYKSRKTVAKYFGLSKPQNVIFTKNSTEAINLFFDGYLQQGDNVVISCYEHNAVLRPLKNLVNQGRITLSVITREDLELSPESLYRKYSQNNTRVLSLTLASNLTGRKIFDTRISKEFSSHGVKIFVDASQGAGKTDISMSESEIDYLAFTGHKDLMAIPGVGGLCCEADGYLRPLIQGGTGIHGEEYVNPDIFPEGLEAGTLNMPAIWSLRTALLYAECHKKEIRKKEEDLTQYLMNSLTSLENVIVYDVEYPRVSTVAFNVKGVSSDRVVSFLNEGGICVRGGIHCAILAHEALGTVSTGAIRVSLSQYNSKQEIDTFIDLLRSIKQ